MVKLATDALDEIRRDVWNTARNAGDKQLAKEIKGTRFALWMNPEKLTERHQQKLAHIQQTNKPLYRAYLIAQQLRLIYQVRYEQALKLLDAWLTWARRSRLQPFVKLAKTITEQRTGRSGHQHGLSNARTEQVNTQLTRDHPPRIRLSHTRSPDRARHAQPRRPLPTTTRPVTPPTDPSVDSVFGCD